MESTIQTNTNKVGKTAEIGNGNTIEGEENQVNICGPSEVDSDQNDLSGPSKVDSVNDDLSGPSEVDCDQNNLSEPSEVDDRDNNDLSGSSEVDDCDQNDLSGPSKVDCDQNNLSGPSKEECDQNDLSGPSELDDCDNDLSGPPYHVVPFKNQLRFVLNIDDPVFDNKIVDYLALAFSISRFTFEHVEVIESLMTALLQKFNDSKYNMAYLTGCLLCVFRKVYESPRYPSRDMKKKLSEFLKDVGNVVIDVCPALYEKWFLCGKFNDWVFLLACVFMPSGQFVRSHERNVIMNAMKFLTGMVKPQRYVFRQNSSENKMYLEHWMVGLDENDTIINNNIPQSSGDGGRNCKRKLDDVGCVESEAKRKSSRIKLNRE